MQISQMGFGQGGEKTQQVYQRGQWWGQQPSCPTCHQWSYKQGSHCHTLHTMSLWKYQKDMCYIWYSNPLQRWQDHQKPPGLPQGQRPYGQPKWCHLLVPMQWPRLWWGIHRGNLQDLWWKIQRAPEGPLSYSSAQQPNRPPTNLNNFQIIGREGHNLARNIKESVYIRVNNPTLNNNIGKFNLSHIWDRVVLNTKGLTLNRQGNNNNNQPNN